MQMQMQMQIQNKKLTENVNGDRKTQMQNKNEIS